MEVTIGKPSHRSNKPRLNCSGSLKPQGRRYGLVWAVPDWLAGCSCLLPVFVDNEVNRVEARSSFPLRLPTETQHNRDAED